ncbi:accessory gene regulator [Clostridia bacterium]|nr:accessory gene regulator [Clostridia bacterium]
MTEKTVSFFIANGAVNETERDIYEYGVSIAISFTINALVTLSLGFIFSMPVEMLVFFVPFMFHRSLAGGYHANSFGGCVAVSAITISVAMLAINYLTNPIVVPLAVALTVVSLIATFALAPVQHINRVLTSDERIRFRKSSRIFMMIVFIAVTLLLILKFRTYALCVTMGVVLSTVTMVLGYILNLRKVANLNENA